MNNVAVILAAGSGMRMKSEKNKLLLEVGGMTVIERCVKTFANTPQINEIIVVCRESDLDEFEVILGAYDLSYCFGGKTRQESVTNAVEVIDECDLIIVHDGARPLITVKEITETIEAAKLHGAAAVGVPVKDTIKVVDRNMKITETPDRSKLIAIRTPQIFAFNLYKEALSVANRNALDFTDDCALIENVGRDVYVVKGEYENIKITTPGDIPMAEAILKMRGELK